MSLDALTEELEDWELVCRHLPSGWQEQARLLGALRRARGFPNAALLLRTLLAHLVGDCSLQETTASAHLAGWCHVSPVALFNRLCAAQQWLCCWADGLWLQRPPPPWP